MLKKPTAAKKGIYMNIQIELAPENYLAASCFNRIINKLNRFTRDHTLTRRTVAEIIESHGFIAHIGGKHVAIHDATLDARLAVVTHTSPDFS